MKSDYRNVCEVIVKNDVCIGCGLCVGVCPPQVLQMETSPAGELKAVEFRQGCLPNCDLCLQVCPFWDRNPDEDELGNLQFGQESGIQHRPETGYYLESFAGYSNVGSQREQGSSGGMATWLLETLLARGLVDRVICVSSNPHPQQLFRFRVCSTVEEIRAASRSAYYPLELSEALRFMLANEGRFAVTGLPCFIKGLRLAMLRFPRLRRRIAYLVGITCAQTQSARYAGELCRMKGGDPASMVRATFRVKDPARPANDYGFQFDCQAGEVRQGRIFFSQGMGELWLNGFFTPNACNYCDDLFAEAADITFMDAWLRQYQADPKGHNLAIVRSAPLLEMMKQAASVGELALTPLPIEDVIRSQQGGLKRKRQLLALRLARDQKQPPALYRPRKRPVSAEGLEFEERWLFELRERLKAAYRAGLSRDAGFSPRDPRLRPLRMAIRLVSKSSFLFRRARRLAARFRFLSNSRPRRPSPWQE